MSDWRNPDREEQSRGSRRRELQTAPWYNRQDRNVERGFGEGEFERGGRPSGGYAQGGYETHLHAEGYGGSRGQGYGSYGGGAYRERRVGEPSRSFRAEERRVREVMTPHAEVLDPNMTVRDAARRMRADNLGAYPVGEFDRLVGMITDRDIVVRAIANDRSAGATTIREIMSPHVFYCFDDDDVEDVAELMARHQVRRVPVLNHEHRLVGVVALADLSFAEDRAAQHALEGVSERSGVARR